MNDDNDAPSRDGESSYDPTPRTSPVIDNNGQLGSPGPSNWVTEPSSSSTNGAAPKRAPRKKRKWLKRGEVDPDDHVAVAKQKQRHMLLDQADDLLLQQMESVQDGTHPDLAILMAELDRRRDIQLGKAKLRNQYEIAEITRMRDHAIDQARADFDEQDEQIIEDLRADLRRFKHKIISDRTTLDRSTCLERSLGTKPDSLGHYRRWGRIWGRDFKTLLSDGTDSTVTFEHEGQTRLLRHHTRVGQTMTKEHAIIDLAKIRVGQDRIRSTRMTTGLSGAGGSASNSASQQDQATPVRKSFAQLKAKKQNEECLESRQNSVATATPPPQNPPPPPRVQPQPQPQPRSQTLPQTQPPQQQPQTRPQAPPPPRSQPQPQPQSQPQPLPRSQSQTQPQPQPRVQSQDQSQPKPQPQAQPQALPQPRPQRSPSPPPVSHPIQRVKYPRPPPPPVQNRPQIQPPSQPQPQPQPHLVKRLSPVLPVSRPLDPAPVSTVSAASESGSGPSSQAPKQPIASTPAPAVPPPKPSPHSLVPKLTLPGSADPSAPRAQTQPAPLPRQTPSLPVPSSAKTPPSAPPPQLPTASSSTSSIPKPPSSPQNYYRGLIPQPRIISHPRALPINQRKNILPPDPDDPMDIARRKAEADAYADRIGAIVAKARAARLGLSEPVVESSRTATKQPGIRRE